MEKNVINPNVYVGLVSSDESNNFDLISIKEQHEMLEFINFYGQHIEVFVDDGSTESIELAAKFAVVAMFRVFYGIVINSNIHRNVDDCLKMIDGLIEALTGVPSMGMKKAIKLAIKKQTELSIRMNHKEVVAAIMAA